MLVIFGTKTVGKTIKTGTFKCSRCNRERNYFLKQNKKYFSLFFIPIIPLNKVGDTLECTFCKTAYIPNSILSKNEYSSSTALIDNLEKPLASVGKRIGAYIIDMIFLTLLNFPLAFAMDYLPDFFKNKFYLAFIPLWIIYFFVMEVLFKGTIGKKILSIETISDNNETIAYSNEKEITGFRYFLRSIVKCIPLINIVLIFNDKHKGCHDFIANTIVVEK